VVVRKMRSMPTTKGGRHDPIKKHCRGDYRKRTTEERKEETKWRN
jgi:hypothetical protein